MEGVAEGRSAEIRVAWSVALQRLGMREGQLDQKLDQLDPVATDWEAANRALGAELETLEKQTEAELGALERGR